METLFECSYTRSQKIAKAFYRYILFRRPLILCSNILICLSFIANIIFLALGYDVTYAVIVIAPLFFALEIIRYFRTIKLMIERDKEIADGAETLITNSVSDRGIKCTSSSGSVNEITFDKIKKSVTTKLFILIYSKAKMVYIFPKDSFTKGTPKDFLSFLANKGLK